MAKKGGGGRRMGIVSWLTSIIAILIGLFPAWRELSGLLRGATIDQVAAGLNAHYNPIGGQPALLRESYGALVGGIIFKVVASELAKRARMKSLLPALRA